ncbi:hypothetical protein T05_14172 [Trichinella murrelli]|uniref:Uncharacterized protein n=1 Tax=Trichinella murrelli TaxID=144512 RepID=A0A0V0TL18_9BILA|nr:hypothetical protein T05_14172 [Trichinella murrelli]
MRTTRSRTSEAQRDLCTQPVCLDFGEEIFAMSSIYAGSFLNFQIVKFNCAFELFFNVRLKLMLHREDFPVHSDRFLALHYANKDRLKIALSSVSNGALVRLTYLLLVSSNVLCFYFDMTNEKKKSENADDTKQNNKRQKVSAEYVYANVNEGEHCRWHFAACTLCHANPESNHLPVDIPSVKGKWPYRYVSELPFRVTSKQSKMFGFAVQCATMVVEVVTYRS